jgi:hypothetical protein
MPFQETKTLINNDSDIRIDVESMARIEISDVEYLLSIIKKTTDARLERIMYETIVTKISTVFQLVMRACKYLEQDKLLKKIIKYHSKKSDTDLGKVKGFRDNFFHDGIGFVEKEVFYPFGKINGRGFVAIRIAKGGALCVSGMHIFDAQESEFAITSEGVFEIVGPGSSEERWVLVDSFTNVAAVSYEKIDKIIVNSLSELKAIWNKLESIRKIGDGKNEYQYLNEGGSWEFIEKKSDGEMVVYSAEQKTIMVTGNLTINPLKLRVHGQNLRYE